MDGNWVRSLRDHCAAAGVPYFFKQVTVKGKKVGLPALDGRVWDEMPATVHAG
jgi:protein gp37